MGKSTATAARPQATQAAKPAWSWLLKPTVKPMGWGGGFLTVNGTAYAIECDFIDEGEGRCFSVIDLRKSDGTHHRITVDPQGNPSCDCPDATYRERPAGCKHAQAVREACESLSSDDYEPTDADLAEMAQAFAQSEIDSEFDNLHARDEIDRLNDDLAAEAAWVAENGEVPF